jgi:hypothetical protein
VISRDFQDGSDGTRTRDLRRDRPATGLPVEFGYTDTGFVSRGFVQSTEGKEWRFLWSIRKRVFGGCAVDR